MASERNGTRPEQQTEWFFVCKFKMPSPQCWYAHLYLLIWRELAPDLLCSGVRGEGFRASVAGQNDPEYGIQV